MATDSMSFIVNLLTNNWNNANTDTHTPLISKITEYKRYDYNKNYDAIFIHRHYPSKKPSGLGVGNKDITYNLKLDIRTLGELKEAHWFKVITEVERILDDNIVNPGSSGTFCELRPDGNDEDISDKTHHLWRIMMPIQLIQRSKAR